MPDGRLILIMALVLSAILCVAWLATPPQHASGPATTVNACGSTIDVRFEGDTTSATRVDLLTWVRRAGDAVCTYYGKFPVSHMADGPATRAIDSVTWISPQTLVSIFARTFSSRFSRPT